MGIEPEVQAQWQALAAQVREKLYGPDGCPEWGTKFREIEQQGMSVGLELARLVMEQVVQAQSEQVPVEALVVEGDIAQAAGKEATPLQTEAGPITWDQPRTRMKPGRQAFFRPRESVGTEGR